MTLVLDASAALAIVGERGRGREFHREAQKADLVIAPDLFVPEIVNAVWKYHQFESLSISSCNQQIELALAIVETLIPCKELHREAFLMARDAKKPAYDMFYLALARREDAVLLTSDGALRKEAERQGIQVI